MDTDGCAYWAKCRLRTVFIIGDDFVIVVILLLSKLDGNICNPGNGCWSKNADPPFVLGEELKVIGDESVGLGSLPIGMLDGLVLCLCGLAPLDTAVTDEASKVDPIDMG